MSDLRGFSALSERLGPVREIRARVADGSAPERTLFTTASGSIRDATARKLSRSCGTGRAARTGAQDAVDQLRSPTQERVPCGHHQPFAGAFDGIVGTYARQFTERHGDGVPVLETDDLRKQGFPASLNRDEIRNPSPGERDADGQTSDAANPTAGLQASSLSQLLTQSIEVHAEQNQRPDQFVLRKDEAFRGARACVGRASLLGRSRWISSGSSPRISGREATARFIAAWKRAVAMSCMVRVIFRMLRTDLRRLTIALRLAISS